jgi:hypothetical protein|tara:strand:+ start:1358 stop:1513 length:156 start_codon:yes stop_codon:yes gene_type:complete
MNIKGLKEMANEQIECDYAEVQMYTLIHIAESLEQIRQALEANTLHVLNNN